LGPPITDETHSSCMCLAMDFVDSSLARVFAIRSLLTIRLFYLKAKSGLL